MIFEDDIFKDFTNQIQRTDDSLENMPLIPRSDRKRIKEAATKVYSSNYAEFSCDGSKATYVAGPSQVSPDDPCPTPHKTLDWNHLRLFYYVAECRSFTKAADRLKVSQPLLSRTVQQLEKRLQEQLLHRNRQTRQLTLTPLGLKILDIITPGVLQLESLMPRLQE